MFRVLVVDDEVIVRRGIITSINWEQYDIEIVGEAKNGKDALNKLAGLSVDLVLTDIRMPIMNGIELAHYIKERYPDLEVVLLSGYEDFQYAKDAMQIGIQHYLLKPVIAEKLVETLVQIRDRQQEKLSDRQQAYMKNKIFNESLPVIKSEFMNSLLSKRLNEHEIAEEAKTLRIELEGPEYQIFMIDIDDFLLFTERLSLKEKEAYRYAVLNIAEETLLSHLPGFVCYGELDKLIGLVGRAHGRSTALICEEIQHNIQKYLKLSVTIGIGRPKTSLIEIGKSYAEATLAVQRKAFRGKGAIIPFQDEQDERSAGYGLIFFTDEEKKLISNLKSMQIEGIRETIDHYFERFTAENLNFKEIKGLCIRLVISVIQAIEEMGIPVESVFGSPFIPHVEIEKFDVLADLESWLKRSMEEIIALIEEDSSRNAKKIVKDAVQYVAKNIERQIGLTDVSDHVFVTPTHFSKVFKEEMGVTFIKWLNQYRVEEAKKLLKNTYLKTYEIAENVGYQDYKYFSLIFKKYTGFSPRDYRNQ